MADTQNQSKTPERSLDKPSTEQTPQAPKTAITELLDTNIKIIKHRLRCKQLRIKKFEVGTMGKTTVAVFYIAGVVDQKALKFVTDRIQSLENNVKYVPNKKIVTDAFTPPWSGIFPTVFQTERFDAFCADLMNGRVGIICDNNPYATSYPSLFFENFYGADDYYTDYGRLSIRLMRLLGFFIAAYLIPIYLALDIHMVKYITNPDLKDIFNYTGFFPEWAQVLILIVIYRNLADIVFRLNQHLLLFISIMSANIVGSLAVESHFFDTSTIVIVSLSFIASFQIVNRLAALTANLRYVLMIAAYFWGLWGIGSVTVILLITMALLRVNDIPYLAPVIPFRFKDLRDSVFVRGNLRAIVNREHRLRSGKKRQ